MPEHRKAIRGGEVVVAGDDANVLYLGIGTHEAATANWLASQHWDPSGRTAAALAKLYKGKKYSKRIMQTYVEFLSRSTGAWKIRFSRGSALRVAHYPSVMRRWRKGGSSTATTLAEARL
ncbi:MAG: hypothetical protein NTW28_15805 [Candidatus Solibacter sp.]|nr:hypothetical protein [Candidatus Solibacter sp.]